MFCNVILLLLCLYDPPYGSPTNKLQRYRKLPVNIKVELKPLLMWIVYEHPDSRSQHRAENILHQPTTFWQHLEQELKIIIALQYCFPLLIDACVYSDTHTVRRRPVM